MYRTLKITAIITTFSISISCALKSDLEECIQSKTEAEQRLEQEKQKNIKCSTFSTNLVNQCYQYVELMKKEKDDCNLYLAETKKNGQSCNSTYEPCNANVTSDCVPLREKIGAECQSILNDIEASGKQQVRNAEKQCISPDEQKELKYKYNKMLYQCPQVVKYRAVLADDQRKEELELRRKARLLMPPTRRAEYVYPVRTDLTKPPCYTLYCN